MKIFYIKATVKSACKKQSAKIELPVVASSIDNALLMAKNRIMGEVKNGHLPKDTEILTLA